MTTTLVDVTSIPALGHEEAMDLANEELDRLLAAVDRLDATTGPGRPTAPAGT